MKIEYIKEIFENYSLLSIEDKKKLSERMIKIQNDDRANNFYFSSYYDLESIDKILDFIIKANHFEEFYNSLNDTQKKEFQTRTYITAKNEDNYNLESYEYIADLVKDINIETPNKKDNYKIDFEKLEMALEEADDNDILESVVSIYKNISSPKVLYELVETTQKNLSIIKENVNNSTRSKIEELPLDRSVITTLLLLDIDKEKLDNDIEYRKKLRQERDELYIKRREKGIKEKLDSSRKLVKTRVNKYNISIR